MPKYRSTLEKRVAEALNEQCVNFSYEALRLNYTLERIYKPDFILPNGILIECKGWHRDLGGALRKLRVVKDQHPDVDLRIVWDRLSMKVTTSLTSEQWSEKYGFKYAERLIPEEWIKE